MMSHIIVLSKLQAYAEFSSKKIETIYYTMHVPTDFEKHSHKKKQSALSKDNVITWFLATFLE